MIKEEHPKVDTQKEYWKFWYLMEQNGWSTKFGLKKTCNQTYGLDEFHFKLSTGKYSCSIKAVCSLNEHNTETSELGVLWLELEGYSGGHTMNSNFGLTSFDLKDMLKGLECAERNLLLIGIPFSSPQKWLNGDKEWADKRNAENRKIFNFDELENQQKKLDEQYEQKQSEEEKKEMEK